MTTATAFLKTVSEIQNDIDLISDISTGLGLTLDASEEILEVPGELEDMLREPADALDLPDPLVSVLGLVPFGIGTAIKTIDRIGDAAADVIEQQADIMGALDDALATPRSIINGISPVNTLLGKATDAASFVNGQLKEEAMRLGQSLGDQKIEGGFELGERMKAYEAGAQEWFDARDTLLSPFRDAEAAFEFALDELETFLPSTELFEDAADAVIAVMQPIKNAAQAFENAICIDFTITPEITIPGTPAITITPAIPATYITVFGKKVQLTPAIPAVIIPAIPETTIPAVEVDICKIISQAQSGFDAILETVINSALSLVGVDFGEIADSLLDSLLGPLQPVFNAINRLKDAAADIIQTFTEKLGPLVDNITDLIDALDDATTVVSLFDNTIKGDVTTGPDGVDVLVGTSGEDALFGLSGDDTLAGEGGDFLFGGVGNDILNSNGDEAYGGAGRDTLNGSDHVDRLDGGAGNDHLFGGGGNDLLVGGEDADTAYGGSGKDELFGGDGDDRLQGGNSGDTIYGGSDADTLSGNKGEDILKGGDGADFLYGGDSKDEIFGGGDNDVITGGNNHDDIRGQSGDDDIKGNRGNDVIRGGSGDDTIRGNDGRDTILGGDDNDDLRGGNGNDTVFGGNGDDELRGGGDNDILVSGLGTDVLEGGSGADVFVFNAVAESLNDATADAITDFARGEDMVDLSGLGDGLVFIGSAGFSGAGGEVRFTTTSTKTVIRADLDGDGSGEFKIDLDGVLGGINGLDLIL